MRTLGVLLFLALPISADVLVLKDGGRKIAGRVKEKEKTYEVEIPGEGVTIVFGKDEVDRWIRNPKELTVEADALLEEAKKIYTAAVEEKDAKAADRRFHEALANVVKAREVYAEVRDLFDGHPEIDQTMREIMQLMRLVRERLGSQMVSAPSPVKLKEPKPDPKPEPKPDPKPDPKPEPKPEPRKSLVLADALAVLRDGAKRTPEGATYARDVFQKCWDAGGPLSELAGAYLAYLKRSDHEWRLLATSVEVQGPEGTRTYAGNFVKKSEILSILTIGKNQELRIRRDGRDWFITPPGGTEFKATACKILEGEATQALRALEEYFRSPATADVEKLTDRDHCAAATSLAAVVKSLRTADPNVPVDALVLICAGHLGEVLRSPGGQTLTQVDDAIRDLGFQKTKDGKRAGTRDGLAIDELHRWLASGEYELGVVQSNQDFKGLGDFGVRYTHGLLLLVNAITRGRQYEKAYLYFETTARQFSGKVAQHLQALAKSIRIVSPCRVCDGSGKIRCNVCLGKGKADFQCNTCGGSGKVQTFKGVVPCKVCNGQGGWKDHDCPKCKATGKIDCKARACTKAVAPPKFEDVAEAQACGLCQSRGTFLRSVAFACPDCQGVGMFLRPKTDPSKTVP